ncbi:MAG: hypothetical protein ACKO0Z_11425 [Betaproteobacteria bacterium]
MAFRSSTGHKNRLLGENGVDTGANGFRGIYKNCVIDLYSGTQPATADSATSGTFLGRITLNGGAFTEGASTNGLVWDPPASGVISKPTSAVWQANAVAQGTIGWFRLRGNAADAGGASTALPRIDGTVGITSGELRLTTLDVDVGTPVQVQQATFALA